MEDDRNKNHLSENKLITELLFSTDFTVEWWLPLFDNFQFDYLPVLHVFSSFFFEWLQFHSDFFRKCIQRKTDEDHMFVQGFV